MVDETSRRRRDDAISCARYDATSDPPVDSETALGRCSNARAIMDFKTNSLALELLGMRLTMKLPRPKLRKAEDEEAAEYKISIVRHDRSEARPRARELPNNSKRAGILKKDSLLKYDNRVVNQLLTVEQLQNIENWLGQQPESFAKEEIEELEILEPAPRLNQEQEDAVERKPKDMVDKKQENLVEIMDGFLDEVTKSTNFYRDIANDHNKQLFLKKKVVTLV